MKQDASEEGWRGFLEMCAKIKDPDSFQQLFELFMTYEERETMASRFLIVKALLERGMTQREIAEQFHTSIAQITRGSNALKIVDPKFKKLLEKKLCVK